MYTINNQQSYSISIGAQIEKPALLVSPNTVQLCEDNSFGNSGDLYNMFTLLKINC